MKRGYEGGSMNRRQMMGLSVASALSPVIAKSTAGHVDGSGLRSVLLNSPDCVRATVGVNGNLQTLQGSIDSWSCNGVEVRLSRVGQTLQLFLTAPTIPVHRIHIRWAQRLPETTLVMGDAWERSYGDLAWLPLQAERILPWYLISKTAGNYTGFGVKTGASAFVFWQADAEGVSLWLDVRNGGDGVLLGDRVLELATLVTSFGRDGWATARSLCAAMMSGKKLVTMRGEYPVDAIFGSNDWYYAYGGNTQQGILRDAALVRELAPVSGPKPFTVIDDGYQDAVRFPSLPRLAEDIRKLGVAPGIWIRPTRAAQDAPPSLLLPKTHWASNTDDLVYDPTIPEARARILQVFQEACSWGYDFIKHDFTSYELLGQWGSNMGASPTRPGWSFHDRSRTNAEIITALYRDIRQTVGDERLILGCNTVGHLAAGIFDAQRTGDDVSGKVWDRTRKMGVNTLAFRLPQHGIFFAIDADCVPITPDVPWDRTLGWLQAVAASGSVLLVSPDPRAVKAEQKTAIRRAFSQYQTMQSSEPLDWIDSRTPSKWRTNANIKHWDWLEPTGASPFDV
jgi:alpha-galactosidase